MCKECRIVTAAHQLQHLVASRLQRDMEMRHKTARTRDIFYYLVGEQIRFNGRDTVTFNTFHLVECFHQIEETFSCSLAKVTDVDTRQHDFLAAFCRYLPSLFYQIGNLSITASTARKRNGTVGTEIIAPVLHLQEIARTVALGTRRHKGTDILCSRGDSLTMLVFLQIAQIFHQVAFLFGPQYKIYSFNVCYLSRLQLSIASRYHNKGPRMFFRQTMDSLSAFLIRHFSHRTSINHTDVRLFALTSRTHTCLLQYFSNSGSFCKIQFAA